MGGKGTKHRKKAAGPPADAEEQMALFADTSPRRAAPKPQQTSAMGPQAELRRLDSAIARASKLDHREVNYRLNRKAGIRSRAGADYEVIRRVLVVAQTWFTELNASVPEPPDRRPAASCGPTDRRRTSTSPRPTPEQHAAMEVFRTGSHMTLQAGAGTGKTTTLTMLARSDRRRGQYIAFNKPVAVDARDKFPGNVTCRTGHSLAMEAVGKHYASRLNAPREAGWKAGAALGISLNMRVRIGDRVVTNKALSYTVFRTVKRFCHSADDEILRYHVPRLRGLESEELHAQLVALVIPYARRAWRDLQKETGVVRFEHDHYLKIWALGRPRILADYLLLDEAQDTNPVIEQVFNAQRSHAQLVMVGDSAQAIYGWRGARDVMSDFDGQQLSLSQSFRFGPALAHEANRWLTIVDAPIRLQGAPAMATELGPLSAPAAILCRSNVGAMMEILRLLEQRCRVALVGGGEALEKLALAAGDLKAGRRVTHPELVLFQNWGELQEYAESDPSGGDLLPLVNVIDEYGVEVILDAVRRLHSEAEAEVTVSTAHKAKGREWPTVQISPDFEPESGNEVDDGIRVPKDINLDEARLSYVAVTRARQRLDLGGLAWIDHHPAGRPHETSSFHSPTPATASVPSPSPAVSQDNPWDRLGPSPQQP